MPSKKNMFPFLALFFLTLLSHASVQAQSWLYGPNPNGSYGYDETLPDLLNINGLSYREARPLIMGAGWKPLQTLYEGTDDYEMNATSEDAKAILRKGFHELQSCTGGGPSYCAFLFQNKNGDQLRVVTKGEQWDEPSPSARVAGYRLIPKN